MSAADIGEGALIINPDGSLNVDVLTKVRAEYKTKSFIKNMYAKALLLCLNIIAERYYKGSKPGEVDRTKRLDSDVAQNINEQFSALLKSLSQPAERDVDEHREFIKDKVTMFIRGTLPKIRRHYAGDPRKKGLVDAHKDVVREAVKANLTEDEAIIMEDESFRDFMHDLDAAKKEDFETGTRGVFLFAFKIMGANLKDAMVKGATTAKDKIVGGATSAKQTIGDAVNMAASVMHRRGKSGEVKVPEVSGPIGIPPVAPMHAQANASSRQQPAEYVPAADTKRNTLRPGDIAHGKVVPPPPPKSKQVPPPLPERRPSQQASKPQNIVKPPPLPTKEEMAAKREAAAKPVTHSGPVYGNVQLKRTAPQEKQELKKDPTEFQKMREALNKTTKSDDNPPRRGPSSPSGSSI